jgi:hypothetical protein
MNKFLMICMMVFVLGSGFSAATACIETGKIIKDIKK